MTERNEFALENNDLKCICNLSYNDDKVIVNIKENSKEEDKYENSFTLQSLCQKSKVFQLLNNIKGFSKFLSTLIDNKKYIIEKTNDKIITLRLIVNVTGIGEEEVSLEVLKVEKETNIIHGFYDSFSLLHNKVSEYENTFRGIQNDYAVLKGELEKLINENDKLIKDNSELKKENAQLKVEKDALKQENSLLQKDINTFREQMQSHLEMLSNTSTKAIYENDTIIKNNIITDQSDLEIVYKWISPNKKIVSRLLYQATKDGDKADTFHKLCDGISPTLTLIKTDKGKRFGGYTESKWEPSQVTIWKKDEYAFIFSIDKRKKYKTTNPDRSICCNANDGPCFGYGCDIGIRDNFLTNEKNFNSTPSTYKTTKKYELNDGEKYFKISELEVYHLSII